MKKKYILLIKIIFIISNTTHSMKADNSTNQLNLFLMAEEKKTTKKFHKSISEKIALFIKDPKNKSFVDFWNIYFHNMNNADRTKKLSMYSI